MKIFHAALACGALALGAVAGAHPAQAQGTQFPDVPANHWAYQAVMDLANKGYVKGYPDGKFLGSRTLTRYEFATVIDRIVQTVDGLTAQVGALQTPTGTPVTQDDLNKVQALVDNFQTELTTIQSNIGNINGQLDTLRQDVADVKATANKALASANDAYGFGNRKFVITGYVQARYQDADSGSHTLFPQGSAASAGAYNGTYATGHNAQTFDVRRARLRFLGALTNQTHYAVQIDVSGAIASGTSPNQQVTTREAWVGYTFGDGTVKNPDGTLVNPTLTAGLFANPFGYILPASASTWITPERPLAFSEGGQGLWTNEDYDKGVQFSYFPGALRFTYALVNGSGRTSDSVSRQLNSIARIAYVAPTKKVGLGLGVSYYNGQISNYSNAAVPTSQYSDNFSPKKQLLGVDGQFSLPVGLFVDGEYVAGKYERRSYFNGTSFDTDPYVKNNAIQGYYVWGGWNFAQTSAHPFTLAADLDKLYRSRSAQNNAGNQIQSGQPFYGSNASFDDVNYGFGALYNLDKATRLRLWYDKPWSVAHAPGTATPPRIGMYTAEMQVKF